MTTTREDWRDWPELRVIAPSADASIPAHVETALQRRYADVRRNMTPADERAIADDWRAVGADLQRAMSDYESWHAEHCRGLATEIAPSPPLAARRRWGWPEVATAVAIVAVVIALVALLRQPIVTGV